MLSFGLQSDSKFKMKEYIFTKKIILKFGSYFCVLTTLGLIYFLLLNNQRIFSNIGKTTFCYIIQQGENRMKRRKVLSEHSSERHIYYFISVWSYLLNGSKFFLVDTYLIFTLYCHFSKSSRLQHTLMPVYHCHKPVL